MPSTVVIFLLMVVSCWADGVADLPAGTTLKHFTQIDTQVFAGSKPGNDADFEFLHAKGVKYILQAEFLPGLSGHERDEATKFGIEYLSVPMNASPVFTQRERRQ